ncbi:hypothetical protein [Bradyrhizobium canariense]|uniref:hypothetical protein n=1 Tax=Bradyrhizobium canariense TaxID=255045 RepID=UPI001B8A692B|nr:hypothetical protein [Bradyrhizobium canariense]MBR0949270.1 hypothetical protein [Bradyrhizobium canariense]
MAVDVERYLWSYKYIVAVVLASGLLLAVQSGNHEWINRFGALLVVCSLALTLAQFVYESRMPELVAQKKASVEKILDERVIFSDEKDAVVGKFLSDLSFNIDRTRYKILIRSLAVAALGELLHGFGDILFDEMLSLVRLVAQKFC